MAVRITVPFFIYNTNTAYVNKAVPSDKDKVTISPDIGKLKTNQLELSIEIPAEEPGAGEWDISPYPLSNEKAVSNHCFFILTVNNEGKKTGAVLKFGDELTCTMSADGSLATLNMSNPPKDTTGQQ